MTGMSEAVSSYSPKQLASSSHDFYAPTEPGGGSQPETCDANWLIGSTQSQSIVSIKTVPSSGQCTLQAPAIAPDVYTQKVSNCYARGTRILTLAGEVAVEALQVGDMVVTFGDSSISLKPIRWLGHRRVDLWRHPERDTIRPIRIRANALGDGCPRRDLLVSPSHRLRIDDVLIAARELVNGASIVQESPDEAEYWHVELYEHELILAEGVQAETYQGVGNHAAINHTAIALADPTLDEATPKPCLPYAEVSTDTRARLIARAEMLGWPQTFDAAPWLEVDGNRIEPRRQDARYRFTLPAGCRTVRLRSRAVRPWDIDAQSTDRRHLGLKLHRLALSGPGGVREVALTSPDLYDGFNAVERDENGWIWRWTTGDAVLDLTNLSAGEAVTALEIDFDQALAMWIEPAGNVVQNHSTGRTTSEAERWAMPG